MDREAAAKRNLYDAATKGDVTNFQQLLQEDPYLLDEVSFACAGNLLHVATMRGQLGIVKEVLKINPQLATSLNSKSSSPLHIAAAQGHVEIASKLIAIAPEACWWRDCHDMNPVHIAAMNGHVDILNELLKESHLPAMERVHRGTVLHLCLKHGQIQTFKVLAVKLGEIVAAKDDDRETLLHVAVRCDQLEAIRYLVEDMGVKKDIRNSMGKTALKLLLEIPKATITNHSKMKRILQKLSRQPKMESMQLNEITLIVVTLVATMAFQVIVNPAGGVWQESAAASTNSTSSTDTTPHKVAGGAIMKSANLSMYVSLLVCGGIALGGSGLAILLIITGSSSRHHFCMWLALLSLWVSIASIACCAVVSGLFIFDPERAPVSAAGAWTIIGGIYLTATLSMAYLLELYPWTSSFWESLWECT